MLMKPGSGFAAAVVLLLLPDVGGGARGAVGLPVLDALHAASPLLKMATLSSFFAFLQSFRVEQHPQDAVEVVEGVHARH